MQLDQAVAVGLGLEPVAGRLAQPELLADPLGELRVGVEPGARGRAAQRDLGGAAQSVAHPVTPERDLRCVAAELLAERDRDRIHHVRAARLHHVGPLAGLAFEGSGQALERRKQLAGDGIHGGQVHRAREHVVGRLAHVHVVVGVRLVAGEVGDHLVRVRVRGRARAGLEHVDRELVIVAALGHLVARAPDSLRQLGVQEPELAVHARGGGLDAAQPVQHRGRHPLAGDGKVLHCLACLHAPELLPHLFDRHGPRLDD